MTSPRNLLLIALLFIGYLMWMQWQEDYHRPPATTASAPATHGAGATSDAATPDAGVPAASVPGADVPATEGGVAPTAAAAAAPRVPEGQRIVVTTDVLRVEIDTRGGNVVVADLLDYARDPKHPERVRLLDDQPPTFFEAQSGLVGVQGSTLRAPDHNASWTTAQTRYELAPGTDTLEVVLDSVEAGGLAVRKVYAFARGSYAIGQRHEIRNEASTSWTGNAYRQLQRVPPLVDTAGIKGYSNTERYSFAGAAWYSPTGKFEKLAFDDFASEPLSTSFQGGWGAMLQHYFFAAWIPESDEPTGYSTTTLQKDGATRYLIRTLSPTLTVAPGETRVEQARLYVGPKLQSTLDEVAPGLALTVDYGIFTVISEPLHWVLAQFHKLTGNWGFAIILLVLLLKAVFFKLTEAQYRSTAKMRKLQPRMAALKERYGDDRQKMNQAMMELYQKEKINPLGGCLPMLVQMPVFFALYWVLLESVELRQAPFIGWIQNLTAPDPYYVLPALNGLVMIATSILTPTAGMDPTQAKIMKFMPVIFSVMFAFFPAGLVLYWTVNGALSLLQQWIITRRIERGDPAAA